MEGSVVVCYINKYTSVIPCADQGCGRFWSLEEELTLCDLGCKVMLSSQLCCPRKQRSILFMTFVVFVIMHVYIDRDNSN